MKDINKIWIKVLLLIKNWVSEKNNKKSFVFLWGAIFHLQWGVNILSIIVREYISQCYITLMLLLTVSVILIVNRKTKIDGTQFVWFIIGLTFILTSCEYIEYWCDTYNKPLWILYVKTALVYLIYPLISLLELYLVVQIKNKILTAIPYMIYSVLVIINMFGVHIIYAFAPNHSYIGEYLRMLPVAMMFFYLILLVFCSPQFIKNGFYSKSLIIIFMAFATILTTCF